jgi:hypothetical protein
MSRGDCAPPGLNSKKTWNSLPPSWWTLYILARVPVADLRGWLTNGTVNCETTANEAQALYPGWQSFGTPKPPLIIRDPDPMPPNIDVEDLALIGPSAERTQTLETLGRIGFDMGDVEDELADIAASAEGTRDPARKPVESRAWLLRTKIMNA